MFRFGPAGSWHAEPARRRSFPGLRFPVDAFDAFLASSVPRWGCNNALTQAAYGALLARLDPGVIILTHSQGGSFGLTAALNAPERLRAVIALEPSGAPDPSSVDPAILKHVPHLFIWGDTWTESQFWVQSRPACEKWHEALSQAGCDTTFIDLPKVGIHGNSHALMADDNSDDVAALVIQWMRSRDLIH